MAVYWSMNPLALSLSSDRVTLSLPLSLSLSLSLSHSLSLSRYLYGSNDIGINNMTTLQQPATVNQQPSSNKP